MNNMENSYSIKDLFFLFLSKIWILIICAVIGAAGAFFYTYQFMPLMYSSHISMYIQCYTTFNENPEYNYNNINSSKSLINTYIQVMKDDAVMESVADELIKHIDPNVLSRCFTVEDNKISSAALRNCYNISSVTDTSAVNVNVTCKDPVVAAEMCNAMARVFPDYIKKAVDVGTINTIDTAKVYYTPVAPNKLKNTAIGGIAGLMLAALVILLIDFFDNTVKDISSVSNKYSKSSLGEIQMLSNKKHKKKDRQTNDSYFRLTDKDLPFHIVETYKSVRTNISFALAASEKKILVISSSNPNEGKSTVTANTAIALAQTGEKVLLIDGDMRKPVQHKIFGLKNKKGLSTVLGKMNKIEECISKNVAENLDVLTAGPIPPNPSELLGSEQMKKMLDKLSEDYSVIIIDTPPVNVVTDAAELSELASGIVLVLRYGNTTLDDVDIAMKKIELSNMNMLGFILNEVNVKSGNRYYSKYKYKYKYNYDYSYSDAGKTAEGPETNAD